MPYPWYNTHITQGFKWGRNPPSSPNTGTTAGHSGIDLAEDNGTPLTTPVSGEVIHASAHPWGGEVDIKFTIAGQDYVLSFLHLSELGVEVGRRVIVGNYIGKSGGATWSSPIPTGSKFSSGPHLHFELTHGPLAPYQDYSPWRPTAESYPMDPTSFFTTLKKNGLANDQSALAAGGGFKAVAGDGNVPVSAPGKGSSGGLSAAADVPGFLGLTYALDRAEYIGPYEPPKPSGNPFDGMGYALTWTHDNFRGMMTRWLIATTGVTLLILLLFALIRKPAVAGLQIAAQAAPLMV